MGDMSKLKREKPKTRPPSYVPAEMGEVDDGMGMSMVGAGLGAAAGVGMSMVPGLQQFAPALIAGGAMVGGNIGGMESRAKNLATEADYFARVAQLDREYLESSNEIDRDLEWEQYLDSIDRYREAQVTSLTPNKGHYNMPWRIG